MVAFGSETTLEPVLHSLGRGAESAASDEAAALSSRVVIGTAVFMLGVLAGAGIAAWIVPPL